MIVFESKKARRFVMRLDRGEEIVAALEKLPARERIVHAWVRGVGSLSAAELQDQTALGPSDLLTLEGTVGEGGVRIYATLARRGGGLSGGRLLRGVVTQCELVIDGLDQLSAAEEHEDEDEAEAETAPSISWADVAAVSSTPPVKKAKERPRSVAKAASEQQTTPLRPPPIPEKKKRTSEEEFLTEPLPTRGDFIDHPQFGLCKVDREDEEGGLMIRLPSGVRKTIKLDFMEVGQVREEGTRRVYPVRPRRR